MASQNISLGETPKTWTEETVTALQVKEQEGSETASTILKTIEYNANLIQILEDCDDSEAQKLKIVDLLYTCLTLNMQNTVCENFAEKLDSILTQLFNDNCAEIGELDMKIRFCFCILNFKRIMSTNETKPLDILKEGVFRYSDNIHFYFLLLRVLSWKNEYEQGLSYAAKALEKFPHNAELLYCRATMVKNIANLPSCEIEKAFQDFLNVAPRDHRKVPEAYFTLSSVYLRDFLEDATEHNWQQMESSYESGLKAENDQLPCYLPYGDSNKSVVGDVLKAKNELSEPKIHSDNISATTVSKLEKKLYLNTPSRKLIIRKHREILQKYTDLEDIYFSREKQQKLQSLVKHFSSLLPIKLEEMNSNEDKLFENRIVELLIIDEPILLSHSINLITEDENGEVSLLYIRNIKKDKETLNKFQAGCRLAIINPYLQCGANHRIINDEPDCIVHLEKVNNMCRYCGDENATQMCSKCKRSYCSRECQKLDWSELGHKLICSLKVASMFAASSISQDVGTQTLLNL